MCFKKNKENPIHETDALAELVRLPALILLVSELPDSLSTDTITPTGVLSHEWKNLEKQFAVYRLQIAFCFHILAIKHTHLAVFLVFLFTGCVL